MYNMYVSRSENRKLFEYDQTMYSLELDLHYVAHKFLKLLPSGIYFMVVLIHFGVLNIVKIFSTDRQAVNL